jgi:short-subunit dehydrogenase
MRARRSGSHPDPVAGRRVLITGGSSGIGLACARELTARGARVALLARGEGGLRRAAQEIDPPPPVFPCDITDVGALETALAGASEQLGGLDVVVANAAAAAFGPFADMKPDDYRRTVETALLGMMNTAHVALPYLERSAGTLVVVGSTAGRIPTPWMAAYTGAKHGVRGFVRTLRAELQSLGSPAKLAIVAPGPVDTPFWRRARMTDGRLLARMYGAYEPEDVAREVSRAIDSPRAERTVGGAMAVWLFLDALAPNVMLRVLGSLAKLGWRKRESKPRNDDDGLTEPVDDPHVHTGLPSRPSVLVRLRELTGIGR